MYYTFGLLKGTLLVRAEDERSSIVTVVVTWFVISRKLAPRIR